MGRTWTLAGNDETQMPHMVGRSPAWREVLELLPRAAQSGLPVMVLGETGSGKELVARAIHALSRRRTAPFVAHNCGATPDSLIESELFGHTRGAFTGAVADRAGLFDAADHGTLFLDEIGDASALLQMKLLRVLQEGEARRVGETRMRRLDVRIVTATHRRVEQALGRGTFRRDLYYRLNTVCVHVPPLRERGEDVVLLARHFVSEAARSVGEEAPELSLQLCEHLRRHRWPGNVRELYNGCAYAFHVAGARRSVDLEHWPEPGVEPTEADADVGGLHAETRALEQRRLREALARTHGNKTRAARALGLSRQGLLKKLRRYGLLGTHLLHAEALDAPEGAA